MDINRLSIGAQSFHPEILKQLGRTHSPSDTEAAIDAALEVGFSNISIDLIFGVPTQTLDILRADLKRATSFDISHLSAYALTIEKGTPFFQRYKNRALKLPAEKHTIAMMQEIPKHMKHAGYTRYEVSNFARPGKEARHNLSYWNSNDYLGLGAGAHSFLGANAEDNHYGKRWSNYALPAKYSEAITSSGQAKSWSDSLTQEDAMFEFFFLGLRKIEGVSADDFRERFSISIEAAYPHVKRLEQIGMLLRRDNRLFLSNQGLMVMDSVLEHFTPSEAQLKADPDENAGMSFLSATQL